jgi:hypothetical protein
MDYEAIDSWLKSINGSLNFYPDKLVLCFKNEAHQSDIQEYKSFSDFLRAHFEPKAEAQAVPVN